MKLRLLVLPAIVLVGASAARALPFDLLVASQHTFAVLPATSITDGDVSEVSWSADGEHLIVAERSDATSPEGLLTFSPKEQVNGPLVLLGWDRGTHQVRRLWSTDEPTAQVTRVNWLPKTSCALATMKRVGTDQAGAKVNRYGVLYINAATGEFHWVPGLEDLASEPGVLASPTQAKALITFNESNVPPVPEGDPRKEELQGVVVLLSQLAASKQVGLDGNSGSITVTLSNLSYTVPASNYWTIDRDGRVARSIHLEKPLNLPATWNADGSNWFLRQKDPHTQRQVLMSLSEQGVLTPTNEAAYEAPETQPELAVDESETSLERGKTKTQARSLWLHGDKPDAKGSVLLAPDGQEPQLSPSGRAVFFIDHGVAKVREIAPITPQQVQLAEQLEAQRPREILYQVVYSQGITLGAAGNSKAAP